MSAGHSYRDVLLYTVRQAQCFHQLSTQRQARNRLCFISDLSIAVWGDEKGRRQAWSTLTAAASIKENDEDSLKEASGTGKYVAGNSYIVEE